MAEDRSEPSEPTGKRTVSTDRFLDGLPDFDDRETMILVDEAGSETSGRRRRASYAEDAALRRGIDIRGDLNGNRHLDGLDDLETVTSPVDDPLGLSNQVSNRDLKKKLEAHARRLDRLEEKIDLLLEAVGPRPVGEVLQDVVDDELTQREAADELGWCKSRVSKVINEIDAAGDRDE